MAPVPEWMQPLLSAGVLQDVLSSDEDNHPSHRVMLNSISQSHVQIEAKAVDATSSIILPSGPTQPPSEPQIKVKRSAMLKAYAHSIRGLMTPDSDLSVTRQALFIASPLQKGIPIGVNQEFVNEAIFQHGNAVQSPLTPIYRSGVGNYFDILNKYVSNVKDVFSSDAESDKKLQNDYLKAKAAAEAEYEIAVKNFEKIKSLDSTVKFQEWMNQYATSYADACKYRDLLADKLRRSSVKLAKEILDDAQARLQPKQGNNMPCAYLDVDIVGGHNATPMDIVYRPRYYLSGYNNAAKRWRNEYMDAATSPQKRIVSFENLKEKTWEQLGIIGSDSDDDIATALNATFEVTLTYTGIGVFDVKRGLWDVDEFRTLLPDLASTAPLDCKQPVYKTSKLLLAYGVNLTIKLPDTVDEDVAKRLRLMPGLLDDLPLTLVQGNTLHAQPQKNDAYPVLLAVLANVC